MKKILFAVMALATITFVGCKDDEDDNAANNNQSSNNSTVLAKKAFAFQTETTVSSDRKRVESVDVTTFVLNFLDASRVQVERAIADVTDGDTMFYSAARQVVNYVLNSDNQGSFNVTMDGTEFSFNFSVGDSSLSLTFDGQSLMAPSTAYTADQTPTDVIAGTSWEIDDQLRNRVFSAAYEMILNTDFLASFDAEGNTGRMHFYHAMMDNAGLTSGINVELTYNVQNINFLNRPYGTFTLDNESQIGRVFANMVTGAEYVMIDDDHMVIHMHVTPAMVNMINIDPNVTDIYVPMVRSNQTIDPDDDPNGGGTNVGDDVDVTGTAWQFEAGAMSGTLTFQSATAGVMHISISSVNVNADVPFTYVVNGNQVEITLDESDAYVSNMIRRQYITNPLTVTVNASNDQISFSMNGNTISASRIQE